MVFFISLLFELALGGRRGASRRCFVSLQSYGTLDIVVGREPVRRHQSAYLIPLSMDVGSCAPRSFRPTYVFLLSRGTFSPREVGPFYQCP